MTPTGQIDAGVQMSGQDIAVGTSAWVMLKAKWRIDENESLPAITP